VVHFLIDYYIPYDIHRPLRLRYLDLLGSVSYPSASISRRIISTKSSISLFLIHVSFGSTSKPSYTISIVMYEPKPEKNKLQLPINEVHVLSRLNSDRDSSHSSGIRVMEMTGEMSAISPHT